MKKVSVIMPMYNAEKVVSRSVHSLFAQTLKDFEVIFVNDCSTDNTVTELKNIISRVQRNDISVKIISHDQNRGVACARNTGLDNAKGKYVYFLDADDYFEPYALSTLYENALLYDADIIGCEWLLSFRNNARHMTQPEVKSGRDAFEKMCYGVMRWNLWLFLVKRDLYEKNQISFIPEANMGEDMMVMMKLLLSAGRIHIIHSPLYHYIQTNSDALTKNFAACHRQISQNVLELEKYCSKRNVAGLVGLINQLKLNLKLPLLISSNRTNYKLWQEWFPESNAFIGMNPLQPLRTKIIQRLAAKKCYIPIQLYYIFVIKFVYGVIYK